MRFRKRQALFHFRIKGQLLLLLLLYWKTMRRRAQLMMMLVPSSMNRFKGLFSKSIKSAQKRVRWTTTTKWPPSAFWNEVTPLGVSEVSTTPFLTPAIRRRLLRLCFQVVHYYIDRRMKTERGSTKRRSMQKCTGHFGLYSLRPLFGSGSKAGWGSRNSRAKSCLSFEIE